MLNVIASSKYRKDHKKLVKRGYNMKLLEEVIFQLRKQIPLAPKYCDHKLGGDWAGFRECHIEPDWLLIYRVEKDELILALSRTGTHSDFSW